MPWPMKPIPIRTISSAAAIALLLPGIAPGQAGAQGQPQRGGQGEAVQAAAPQVMEICVASWVCAF